MSSQIWDTVDVGYATRILENEVNEECLGCGNKFALKEKVYMMHKKNGTTIYCTSLECFKKQGGHIDEYQITTVISRKIIQQKAKPITKRALQGKKSCYTFRP